MNFIKNTLLIGINFIVTFLFSQESLPFYQQYLLSDKVLINPSYTGSNDYIVLKGTYHKQWGNFDLSPNTQTISTHFNLIDRVGVGAYFFKDENGPVSMQGVNVSGAYHIPLNDESREQQFSFGASVSLFSQVYDWSLIKPEQVDDPLLYGDKSIFLPYINLGVSFKYKGIFGGVSVLDIPISNNTPIVNSIEPSPTWYYLNLGYDWRVSDNIAVEPSVLMNINTNSERHFDLNLFGKLISDNSTFELGFSYRTDLDEKGTQALTFSPIFKGEVGQFNFGIGYNMGLSDISRVGGNGFILGLGYNFENFINPNGFRYR